MLGAAGFWSVKQIVQLVCVKGTPGSDGGSSFQWAACAAESTVLNCNVCAGLSVVHTTLCQNVGAVINKRIYIWLLTVRYPMLTDWWLHYQTAHSQDTYSSWHCSPSPQTPRLISNMRLIRSAALSQHQRADVVSPTSTVAHKSFIGHVTFVCFAGNLHLSHRGGRSGTQRQHAACRRQGDLCEYHHRPHSFFWASYIIGR